jgi:hypothetical protein
VPQISVRGYSQEELNPVNTTGMAESVTEQGGQRVFLQLLGKIIYSIIAVLPIVTDVRGLKRQ